MPEPACGNKQKNQHSNLNSSTTKDTKFHEGEWQKLSFVILSVLRGLSQRALTIPEMWAKMNLVLPPDPDLSGSGVFVSTRGPVAQLGARFHGMEEVAGSIPARSTISLNGKVAGSLAPK